MKFAYFKFENFKGIENQTLDLTKSAGSNIFTLVGLNESGKTTLLEAINYFSYKTDDLGALGLDGYQIEDIHELIPINKRDNFNGRISISAGFKLTSELIVEIKNKFKEHDLNLETWGDQVEFFQHYYFENSRHQEDKDESLWRVHFRGKKKRAKNTRDFTNEEKLHVNNLIQSKMPSILYFPNFLFEFPERLYLEENNADEKQTFYQNIIQDILDSLENDTNIKNHLIERIDSPDSNEKRSLMSLIGKMEKKLTEVIFGSWDEIFNKVTTNKEIVLLNGSDNVGKYIEFYIKDDVDTYKINERSLGFRWFFVYILLTQFRNYRKKSSNTFFLFDEPASNLHPSAQSELLKSFENLPSVLYTTHSHYLINPKWLESTYVVQNKGIDYDNEQDYKATNTDINIMKYREFATKHPTQTSYFQPILELLDYRPANLELVPKVVLTEGKNDFYTFMYFQKTIKNYKVPVKFIPGSSSSNLERLISLYLGWGMKFLVLLDSDDEGERQKNRYINLYGDYLIDFIVTYEDINDDWEDFETEDLFSTDDQLLIQKEAYPQESKYKKKFFNRSIQESFVTGKALDLSDETKSNFKIALDFLKKSLK